MASDELVKLLECSICLNIFKDPVTLPCGHNFCQDCINHEFTSKVVHDYCYSLGHVVYPCPECRNFSYTPYAFTRNINLRNMAEHVLRQTNKLLTASGTIGAYRVDSPIPDLIQEQKTNTSEPPNKILHTEELCNTTDPQSDLQDSAPVRGPPDLRKNLECSICLDIFKDPVTLRCGHNFCRDCINHNLETHKVLEDVIIAIEYYVCPECKDKYSMKPLLVRNVTLRNMAKHLLSQTNRSPAASGTIRTY